MNEWYLYVVLAFTQVANAWARSWNIRCVAQDKKLMAHVSWQVYGVVWIISLSIGIKSFLETDWIGILIWFVSSGFGLEIGMRMKKK